MAQPTTTTMSPSQKRFDLISGCVRSAMRRLRYGFSPPIWVWISYASNPKLVRGICLTYFFHDIFKCHELSSSVLLKSKKRKEAIKREKLAAASSWASYTCVWWQAYITKSRVHVPWIGGVYAFKVSTIRVAISSCCWPHVAAGVA